MSQFQNGDGFKYSPLQDSTEEIRLVTLHPQSQGDGISCELANVRLDHIGEHEALSYTWGSSKDQKQILVNGYPTFVTANLHSALEHLRLASASRVLWIDALCIDQENVQERNHQVRQMDRIYSRAKEVAVWLGPVDGDSDMAMDFIALAGAEALAGRRFTNMLSHTLPIYGQALSNLLSRDYWRRVWILQEIALASTISIYCGQRSLEWTYLAQLLTRLSNLSSSHLKSLALDPIWSTFRQTRPGELLQFRAMNKEHRWTPISLLIETSLKSICSDPRDKIYGILALADEAGRAIEVDYSKTLLEILADVVSVIPRSETGYLALSAHLQHRMRSSIRGGLATDEGLVLGDVLKRHWTETRPTLNIAAFHVGTITAQHQASGATESLLEPITMFRQASHASKHPQKSEVSAGVYPISGSASYGRKFKPGSVDENGDNDRWYARPPNAGTLETTATSLFAPGSASPREYQLCTVKMRERWRKYGSGIRGVMPPNARVGDVIWELEDSRAHQPPTHLIMRRLEGGLRGYEVIGRAFVPVGSLFTCDTADCRVLLSATVLQLLTIV